jgi:predicted regulator of Ras-like GTPase activity (Roadblock/LC7/MglB family)
MTDFRAELERLRDAIPGALATCIMGVDGIPIDAVQQEGLDTDPAGLLVEYSALVEQIRRSAQMLAAGDLEEVAVKTERVTCLLRTINHEFFLAAVVRPEASVGRTRFLLRLRAPALGPALS